MLFARSPFRPVGGDYSGPSLALGVLPTPGMGCCFLHRSPFRPVGEGFSGPSLALGVLPTPGMGRCFTSGPVLYAQQATLSQDGAGFSFGWPLSGPSLGAFALLPGHLSYMLDIVPKAC